jgi:hypothetical protein
MPKKTPAKPKARPQATRTKPAVKPKVKAPPRPKAVAEPLPQGRIEDLRAAERFPERLPVALHVQSGEGEVEHDGTTIDISIFGLQVETTGRLEPGQLVRIPTFGNCIVVWVRTLGPDRPCQAGLKIVR